MNIWVDDGIKKRWVHVVDLGCFVNILVLCDRVASVGYDTQTETTNVHPRVTFCVDIYLCRKYDYFFHQHPPPPARPPV